MIYHIFQTTLGKTCYVNDSNITNLFLLKPIPHPLTVTTVPSLSIERISKQVFVLFLGVGLVLFFVLLFFRDYSK